MNKIWAVLRREFLSRVRTRAFIIGTVLFPVFLGGVMVLPALLLRQSSGPSRIALLSAGTEVLGEKIAKALSASRIGSGADAIPRYELYRFDVTPERLEEVRDSLIARTGIGRKDASGINGVLVMDEGTLVTGRVYYFGDNAASLESMGELRGLLRPVLTQVRLEREGIDPVIVTRALGPIDLTTQRVSDGKLTGQSGEASFMLAYAMAFILYMALILYGTQTMTSVVEEKSNRIMEVLASSLTPFQMMLGKIVGVGAVALLQIGIWGGTAWLFTTYRVELLGMIGVNASAPGFADAIPAIPGSLIVVFLIFFVLGFLLYSSLYAAVGSMCNTVQETQQAQFPVMMLIITGLMTMFALLNNPDGNLAQVLTYIPFWSPFVVPVRYSLAPISLWELLASGGTAIAGLLLIAWVAGRIYRIGILSYGKRATIKDLWRWIRTA